MAREAFKHLAIAEEVKKTIISGRVRTGDLLPSQNELIQQHGASLRTVRRAIDQLTTDGWIRAERGRGTFAQIPDIEKGTSGKKFRMVGFALIGPYSHYDPTIQILLNSAQPVFRSAGKMVSYSVIPQDEQFYDNFNLFLDEISGLLITGHVDEQALQILHARGVKTIVVGHPMKSSSLLNDFCQVSIDTEMAGYLAGQMLHSYGHRDIGFVYVMDNEYYRSVEQGFFRAGLELGARCRAGFKAPNREAEIEIARVIAQDKELTGLVVVGDQFSGRVIQDLERLGVCVPNDKSILSIGGLPRHILQEPNLARIKGSGELMGQEAAQILLSENAKVVHKFLPVAFEPGRTLKIVNGYLQSV